MDMKKDAKVVFDGFKHYKNYVKFLYRKRLCEPYPVNVIFIAGLAKSGTTWLANMFSSLGGFDRITPRGWKVQRNVLYPGIFDEFKNRLAVIKGHTWYSQEHLAVLRDSNLKYFVIVRDPRDQIISEY